MTTKATLGDGKSGLHNSFKCDFYQRYQLISLQRIADADRRRGRIGVLHSAHATQAHTYTGTSLDC